MGRILSTEAYALLSDVVDNDEQPIDDAVRSRVRAGAAISSRDYLQALAERERLKLEFDGQKAPSAFSFIELQSGPCGLAGFAGLAGSGSRWGS